MPELKCQILLDSLHQKKYHSYSDEDIRRICIDMDAKEWRALTYCDRLLQFYLDNPDSKIEYSKAVQDGDAMMAYYDSLVYHIAKNRSRELTLSPSLSEKVYEDITGKEGGEVKLSKHPFVWIVGVLYIAWVILLFAAPGTQSLLTTAAIAIFGAPIFLLSLLFCYCILQFVVVGIYDLYLEGMNLFYLWRHSKSDYGKLEKFQSDYLAASLTKVES